MVYKKMKRGTRAIIRGGNSQRKRVRQHTLETEIQDYLNRAGAVIRNVQKWINQSGLERESYHTTFRRQLKEMMQRREPLEQELAQRWNCFDNDTEMKRLERDQLAKDYVQSVQGILNHCSNVKGAINEHATEAQQENEKIINYVQTKQLENVFAEQHYERLKKFYESVEYFFTPGASVRSTLTGEYISLDDDIERSRYLRKILENTQFDILVLQNKTLTNYQFATLGNYVNLLNEVTQKLHEENEEWNKIEDDMNLIINANTCSLASRRSI